MKNIYSIAQRSLLIALTFWGIVSCVRPDIDGCVDPRGNVRLTVDLAVDVVTRSDETPYQIDNVIVYVFNSADQFVTSCRGERYTGEPYEFYLTLDNSDTYNFIVWTNHGTSYSTVEVEDLDATHLMTGLEFAYDHSIHDCGNELIPDLLHGNVAQYIDLTRNNHVKVPMRPNTYIINFKVIGLPDNTDDFDFSITDNNSHYKFDNTIIDGRDDFTHTRTVRQINNELNTSIKTLRLLESRAPQFVFRNATTTDVLFENDLVQTILDAYARSGEAVDFNTIFTYDIVLTYDTNMGLTVSVNGWDYVPGNEDLE